MNQIVGGGGGVVLQMFPKNGQKWPFFDKNCEMKRKVKVLDGKVTR